MVYNWKQQKLTGLVHHFGFHRKKFGISFQLSHADRKKAFSIKKDSVFFRSYCLMDVEKKFGIPFKLSPCNNYSNKMLSSFLTKLK